MVKKKEVAIRDDICKEEIAKNPVIEKEVVLTGCGNSLFYDPMSGRYFRSDIEHIKKAVNELNRHMIADMYVSLNEFFTMKSALRTMRSAIFWDGT